MNVPKKPFDQFGLRNELLKALESKGYTVEKKADPAIKEMVARRNASKKRAKTR